MLTAASGVYITLYCVIDYTEIDTLSYQSVLATAAAAVMGQKIYKSITSNCHLNVITLRMCATEVITTYSSNHNR